MAITLEQLDNKYREKNATIIIGESILLKFLPEKSPFDSSDSLRALIASPDLLQKGGAADIAEMVRLSILTRKTLEGHVREQESLSSFLKRRKFPKEREDEFRSDFKSGLQDNLDELKDLTAQIKKLEKQFPQPLAREVTHYFCTTCLAFIGSDLPPKKCVSCGQKISDDAAQHLRYLDADIVDYLNGKWFEDYIGKILRANGWKVWMHGSVMGTSGEKHPIDVLAANIRTGNVIVAECKKTQDSFGDKDMLAFKARWDEINAPHGFFIVLGKYEKEKLPAQRIFGRTPGLCFLDDLIGNSDTEIYDRIFKVLA